MEITKIQTLIKEADQLINTADYEMNRAEEDVVSHLVCHTSRKALSNYMRAYLLQNKLDTKETTSLEDLLTNCKSFNPAFNDVDLSQVHCRFDNDDKEFCLSVKQVDYCRKVATKVKKIMEN